jgi:N-acetylneuraminic acid mutarotase
LFGISTYYLESINKVFICGGIDSTDNPKTECYMYNPVTNGYESRDTLPTGRAYGKLVKVKDSLYLVGSVHNFNIPDGALYKYDPAANLWRYKASVPLACSS